MVAGDGAWLNIRGLDLSKQHLLNFFPLPHGHLSFLPVTVFAQRCVQNVWVYVVAYTLQFPPFCCVKISCGEILSIQLKGLVLRRLNGSDVVSRCATLKIKPMFRYRSEDHSAELDK